MHVWKVKTHGSEQNDNTPRGFVICVVVANVWKISSPSGNED